MLDENFWLLLQVVDILVLILQLVTTVPKLLALMKREEGHGTRLEFVIEKVKKLTEEWKKIEWKENVKKSQ